MNGVGIACVQKYIPIHNWRTFHQLYQDHQVTITIIIRKQVFLFMYNTYVLYILYTYTMKSMHKYLIEHVWKKKDFASLHIKNIGSVLYTMYLCICNFYKKFFFY